MAIKSVVDTLDQVEEAYHSLYSERDGRFELTGVEGMKTDADIARLTKALNSERDVSSGYKTRLSSFGEHTPELIEELQGKIEDAELRLAAAGKEGGPDKETIDKLVETRSNMRMKPVERSLDKLKKEMELVTGERNALAAERQRSTISSSVEHAAQSKGVGVQKEVLASGDIAAWGERVFEIVDGAVVTREGVPGVTPGITPEQTFEDIKNANSRPYWFGPTVGAGASGGSGGVDSGADNPFGISKETGKPNNMTAAGQLIRSDPARAARLFAAAGKGAKQFFPHMSR